MAAVRNEATGEDIILTNHARIRFAQIEGHADDIYTSLRRAVPYGWQVGDGLLLADGEVVFATRRCRRNPRDRVVTTVMPKAMAVGNIQSVSGLARKSPASFVSVPCGAATRADRQRREESLIADLCREQDNLHMLDDAALQSRLDEVIEARNNNSGDVKKAYGRLWNTILMEQAGRRRRDKRKQMEALCKR